MHELEITTSALAVAVAARVPVLLWGAPGTGKTSAVRALAEVLDWPCETVIAAIREPSDFAGLPVVAPSIEANGSTSRTVTFAPPRWAERLAAGNHGVLFLDEVSTAPPAVQAALLRVVLERTVGDLTLPEGIAVVAAANPPEQAAGGWDLSAPLANRFCHLDWPVDPAAVVAGFVGGFDAPRVPELAPDWEQGIPRWRGAVSGFLTARPALTCAVPDDAAAAGRGWPSPRSWDMAARLLAAIDHSDATDAVRSALLRGTLGNGAGVELNVFLVELDLPDPEAVLADPGSFDLPDRADRALAVLSAITAAVAANPTVERWNAGWVVLDRAAERAPDVAAVAARVLARCRPPGAPVPREVARFAPLLRRAGLV